MRKVFWKCAAGLAISLGVMSSPVPVPAQAESPVVKIAVVNTLTRGLPGAIVAVAMRPLKAYMQAQTGMTGDIVVGGDAFELAKKLDEETVQIGVFHGHEFAWVKAKYPRLEPIVVCRNPSTNVRAVHVVSIKSKAESFADLKGTTLAMPRENRAYCRVFAERCCVKPGTTTLTYYKQITTPIDCEDALDAVASGKVDSAIVEAAILDEYRANKPAWAKYIRELSKSELFPPGVIACRRGKFTAKQVEAFRSALINATEQPRGKEVMTSMRVAAFTVAPANFQTILDASNKAYPPPAARLAK